MPKDPFDILDNELANLRKAVRDAVKRRIDKGVTVVWAGQGKVMKTKKVAGKPTDHAVKSFKRHGRSGPLGHGRITVKMRSEDDHSLNV